MNGTTQKWIEAGKLLAVDPTASMPCPICGQTILVVRDIAGGLNPRSVGTHIGMSSLRRAELSEIGEASANVPIVTDS